MSTEETTVRVGAVIPLSLKLEIEEALAAEGMTWRGLILKLLRQWLEQRKTAQAT